MANRHGGHDSRYSFLNQENSVLSDFRAFRRLENGSLCPEATDFYILIDDDPPLGVDGIHEDNIIPLWNSLPDCFLKFKEVTAFLPDCDEELWIVKDLLPQKFRVLPVSIRLSGPRRGEQQTGDEYNDNGAENRTRESLL